MLVLDASWAVVRAGRVLRIRSDLETTTIFFDRVCATDAPVPAASLSLTPPSSGGVGRISWESFVSALSEAFGKTVENVPMIEDRAYVRELLQLAVIDDLLGPAGGPHERIVDMSVRDRYLAGKLAPREATRGGIESLEGLLAEEDGEEPSARSYLASTNRVPSSGRRPAGWNPNRMPPTQSTPPAINRWCPAASA